MRMLTQRPGCLPTAAFLFAASLAAFPVSVQAAERAPKAEKATSWCAITQFSDGGLSDWVKLPDQSIHVVRASMQQRTQRELAKDDVVRIDNLLPYLPDGSAELNSKFAYLVRAGAFYLNEDYSLPKPAFRALPFDVAYSPSRRTLAVVNFALGEQQLTPRNLALAVETSTLVEHLQAVCLRAQ